MNSDDTSIRGAKIKLSPPMSIRDSTYVFSIFHYGVTTENLKIKKSIENREKGAFLWKVKANQVTQHIATNTIIVRLWNLLF